MKSLREKCPASNCDDCPDKDCGLLGCFGLVLPVIVLVALIVIM